jgi:hypothetical protein
MTSQIHSRQFLENITVENNNITNYEKRDIMNDNGIIREHGIVNGKEYYNIFRNRHPDIQINEPLYRQQMLRMPNSSRYKKMGKVLRKRKGSRNTQKKKRKINNSRSSKQE